MSSSPSPTIIHSNHNRPKNNGLIDAISEMQQISTAETSGGGISEGFFTSAMQIEFFLIGFRGFLAGALVIFLLLPIAVAAAMGQVPAFGTDISLYDKAYLFILTFSVYSGGLLLILSSGKYITGEYSKAMAQNLFMGAGSAAVAKGVVFVVVYQLVLTFISPEKIAKIVNIIKPVMDIQVPYAILGSYKPILRISSTVVFLYAVLGVVAIAVTYYRANRKLQKQQRLNETYYKD